MKGTKRSGVSVILCVLALGMMLAATIATASAAGTEVSVSSHHVYTDTGVTVRTGDSITIQASGLIHFGKPPISQLTPAGMPLAECVTLRMSVASRTLPRPAPELDCWSLIGKIGSGPPFAIGVQTTVRATSDGELLLGVNDNILGDNSGIWHATVTVETTPAGTKTGSAKKSLSTGIIVIGGVIVAAALIGLVVFGRVRRSRGATPAVAPAVAKAPDPEPAPVPVPAVVPEPPPPATLLAERPVISLPDVEAEAQSPSVTDSPAEGDFTDVNIFEVEFPDDTSLRVGYNYFPEGTIVRFRISQRSRAAATGSFVANGGGIRYHFVTVELGQVLEPNPDGADVSFMWEIAGVPFQYSVRRVPAG